MLRILIGVLLIIVQCVNGVFEFPKFTQSIPSDDLQYFNTIKKSDLLTAIELGVQSVNQEERLEKNLLNSKIFITNGSISHAQYLETFPNEEARIDDNIARKILKSSLYILNSKCLPQNINCESCSNYFSDISLPESGLKSECLRIIQNQRDGHYPFRRLLPANYKDGFYKMFQSPHLPKPREITNLGINGQQSSIRNGNIEEDNKKNLILTQWAQFIEHDLSKSVVTSMIDGTPIECCDREYYKLLPRYVHPSCAPLEGVSPANKYERTTCLNYVRSALAVDSSCNFGPAEQLNEATGTLDLSQLYGFTKSREIKMRSFKKGLLKTSYKENQQYPLLPIADNPNEFCAVNNNSTDDCFMAGDSRVNSNPFTQILYTIFLRNHNKIAKQLKSTNPQLTDELLYKKAKKMNIEIYQYIIYNEWLPIVLGENNAKLINSEPIVINRNLNNYGTSNEFAVAAIRFYLSMLPNALIQKSSYNQEYNQDNLILRSDGKNENIFNLSDNFYKSNFLSYPEKLNIALNAMLQQRAMKMDSNYAETLTKNFLSTKSSKLQISGTDALAWDIQRGRDHGIQGYIKYLQICSNIKVNSWTDLERYIKFEDIVKLKTVYKSVEDIDLIVGGISEQPENGSTVGPTFTCILGEQFSNIRKWQFELEKNNDYEKNTNGDYTSAAKLLCITTQLSSVPKNIFLAPSDTNPLVSCADL